MATINAYRALGLDNVLGSIEVGKLADMIVVDMNQPHLVPVDMPAHRLVHHVTGHDVSDVIVDGKFVVKDRKLRNVDVGAIMDASERAYRRVLKRANLNTSTLG